ncbi:hypothetical protein [Listeria phage P100plus]|uniref:Uncharacterized protein n=11 Tax=Pecentumvirus TaxID=1857844 RepID=A0A060ACA5_9CAUD|nr:virion structural protein [Listeria phage LMSP-25]YP_009043172.1 virion structural protein [Listeria phage LMSP-25]YP_009044635.1 virion structural protein [Listeria phage LP-083-2]YP_009616104.1 virion structural protein [Listeria phage LMTA-34]YP_009616290.1 virion structural protein [Listeria phage LMTA-34]YP_009784612.1 hypothetical protein QLX40_gp100 [Listeria phage LP-124]YP_009793351.1 hypothetical protein QLX42_gp048 [Listeria phage LMTA-57]YP_009793520.1 hypothetical protein QLX
MEIVVPEGYTKISMTKFDNLEDKLLALLTGETLLVRGLEKSTNADVLVKLDDRKYPVTQISYEISITDNVFRERYWTIYDISINALSLYDVFLFEEDNPAYELKIQVSDNVQYTSISGVKDTAKVIAIYEDEEKNLFCELSREDTLYPLVELTKI